MHEEKWVPEPTSGCRIWIGALTGYGYGRVSIGGRLYFAHRLLYEKARGQIPPGMHLDHICRVRCCVNPEHLRVVTPRQNVLENSVGVASINANKTHCKRGHEFTPENTKIIVNTQHQNGMRVCIVCRRRRQRERYEANPQIAAAYSRKYYLNGGKAKHDERRQQKENLK